MVAARRFLVLLTVLAAGLLVLAGPAAAGGTGQGGGSGPGGNGPVVYPPTSRPYGASYAQWNARWWQWMLGTDRLSNPVFDEHEGSPQQPVPVDCRAGQGGPVWFLGGTYQPIDSASTPPSSTVYRSCRIPAGVALFFPS